MTPHISVLDRFRIDGKVALVTGGARGLGLSMATALAEAGANIAIAGRSLDAAREAATDCAADEKLRRAHNSGSRNAPLTMA